MHHDPRHQQFMQFFLTHEPKIYAFIRSLVPVKADADDVLQETALVLWEKFDQFEPGTRFDRWACRVAHYQVLYQRQKKQRDRLSFSDSLVEQLAEEMHFENERFESRHRALSSCLGKLPAGDRVLIQQRYHGELTNRDVAHMTGRSESAISRALTRIQLLLLTCIETTLAHWEAHGEA